MIDIRATEFNELSWPIKLRHEWTARLRHWRSCLAQLWCPLEAQFYLTLSTMKMHWLGVKSQRVILVINYKFKCEIV